VRGSWAWPSVALVFVTSGYEDLARAIDDLIRMKRAAGRPKDLLALEELGALRDELDRGRPA